MAMENARIRTMCVNQHHSNTDEIRVCASLCDVMTSTAYMVYVSYIIRTPHILHVLPAAALEHIVFNNTSTIQALRQEKIFQIKQSISATLCFSLKFPGMFHFCSGGSSMLPFFPRPTSISIANQPVVVVRDWVVCDMRRSRRMSRNGRHLQPNGFPHALLSLLQSS